MLRNIFHITLVGEKSVGCIGHLEGGAGGAVGVCPAQAWGQAELHSVAALDNPACLVLLFTKQKNMEENSFCHSLCGMRHGCA